MFHLDILCILIPEKPFEVQDEKEFLDFINF